MTGIYQSFVDYLKGSYQELHRVIWPTRQETVRLTLVVIGVSLFVAVILGVFDAAFKYAIQTLLFYYKYKT